MTTLPELVETLPREILACIERALDELTRLRKVMEKATWRVSPETDEQKEFVRNWREQDTPGTCPRT